MSERGHGKEAHGGVPVGRRVRVPRGAGEPIEVFINGMEQERGSDYTLHEGEIVFREPILKEDLKALAAAPQADARPRPRRLLPAQRDRRRRVPDRRRARSSPRICP